MKPDLRQAVFGQFAGKCVIARTRSGGRKDQPRKLWITGCSPRGLVGCQPDCYARQVSKLAGSTGGRGAETIFRVGTGGTVRGR